MTIDIFTDGACSGNPGAGGWAAIIRRKNQTKDEILSGGTENTTNNRMELTAAIRALQAIEKTLTEQSSNSAGAGESRPQITLYTDSEYLCNGMTNWIKNWKRNQWKNSRKKPVLNKDLWLILDALSQKYRISWCWVRGHDGHEENEQVDELAREQSEFYAARQNRSAGPPAAQANPQPRNAGSPTKNLDLFP